MACDFIFEVFGRKDAYIVDRQHVINARHQWLDDHRAQDKPTILSQWREARLAEAAKDPDA